MHSECRIRLFFENTKVSSRYFLKCLKRKIEANTATFKLSKRNGIIPLNRVFSEKNNK